MLRQSAKTTKPVNPWGRIVLAVIGILFAMVAVFVPEQSWLSVIETLLNSHSDDCFRYALMIDAGSTGSRIHVYQFHQCQGSTEPLKFHDEILFKQTIPGLSAYSPVEAAQSLDSLLDAAMTHVPPAQHKTTPISVKATAGLRFLGNEQSEAILDAVYERLVTKYPFVIVGGRKEGVTIMEGRDEGVYAWITVNSLLGRLGTNNTAAIFDLGGGSTQIVFEPEKWNRESLDNLPALDHKYELQHDGHHHILYQHSYLGYGLMEARKLVHQHVFSSLDGQAIDLKHPCLPAGLAWAYQLGGDQQSFTGAAIPEECRAVIDHVLDKNAMCETAPCSFNGVHQPTISDSFTQGPIYVFSYFFDRTQPLGLPAQFKLPELAALTEKVCSGAYLQSITDDDLRGELLDRPEWCLDLTYIYRLLSFGYEIPDHRVINVAKKIDGVETGWCLGAAIALLDDFVSS
ncbi:nucleoside diphosphatase Gda1 [Halteromyces radiatus]|uniref:nucleoside diphosphatase Gda1 n=1 Tax=Halteromyces radiatus TaxID=101107 RepID=UPI002220A6EF|nr:nucleoside diphosphatase Gda1 [Halteromyces radiatus]XP_051405790.1 nucleoside diphosphatase Gda1 [Halteromyces radiatus]KAI8082689.1 nucleoside diphosphatase Gda1 [Halteromyces radiatus]KAI8100214.1 nucleoside diphosphatase Gda1 [Halteromyces radiatus]